MLIRRQVVIAENNVGKRLIFANNSKRTKKTSSPNISRVKKPKFLSQTNLRCLPKKIPFYINDNIAVH